MLDKLLLFIQRNKNILFIVSIFALVIHLLWNISIGNVSFHTDIARDFLLLKDISITKDITMIGPATGEHKGLFHGPLFMYLGLVPFILSGGSPYGMAIFWILLFLFSIAIMFFSTKKIFTHDIAILSTLLLAISVEPIFLNVLNPVGALIIMPLFFWASVKYILTLKLYFLVIAFFVIGLIIQFQIAVGLPILIISFIYFTYLIIRRRKFSHILAYFIILLPLSTYIIFDLRHEFLQLNALLDSNSSGNAVYSGIRSLIEVRLNDFIYKFPAELSSGSLALSLIIFGTIIYSYTSISKNDKKLKVPYIFSFYIVLGYFLFNIPYRYIIQPYYLLPFLPILIMIFVASVRNSKNIIAYIILISIIVSILAQGLSFKSKNIISETESSWGFYENSVKNVLKNIPEEEFGYYVYSPELYGYSMRYTVEHLSLKSRKQAKPFEKVKTTVVFIDINEKDQRKYNVKRWISDDVKISKDKEPISVVNLPLGRYALIYEMTDSEMQIPSNPDINLGLTFR